MLCRTCNTEKSLEAFYASNKSRCKECVKASVAANRLANIEAVRSYDRMRGSMPHRVAARAQYQSTPEGRMAHQRACNASNERHPAKRAARIKLRNAVRDGKVAPWPACAVADCSDDKVEGHHPDYSEPLSVVWLCNQHHRAVHAETMELEAP